jgi:hypothetical protein
MLEKAAFVAAFFCFRHVRVTASCDAIVPGTPLPGARTLWRHAVDA